MGNVFLEVPTAVKREEGVNPNIMKNNWYRLFKYVLIGPFLRVYNRPEIEGKENIPAEGAAIMASNHEAVMDSFYFPLLCPRQLTFPAKAEYFTSPGIKGKMQKWFFTSVGQVPLDRTADNAMDSLMNTAKMVLDRETSSVFTLKDLVRPMVASTRAKPEWPMLRWKLVRQLSPLP